MEIWSNYFVKLNEFVQIFCSFLADIWCGQNHIFIENTKKKKVNFRSEILIVYILMSFKIVQSFFNATNKQNILFSILSSGWLSGENGGQSASGFRPEQHEKRL